MKELGQSAPEVQCSASPAKQLAPKVEYKDWVRGLWARRRRGYRADVPTYRADHAYREQGQYIEHSRLEIRPRLGNIYVLWDKRRRHGSVLRRVGCRCRSPAVQNTLEQEYNVGGRVVYRKKRQDPLHVLQDCADNVEEITHEPEYHKGEREAFCGFVDKVCQDLWGKDDNPGCYRDRPQYRGERLIVDLDGRHIIVWLHEDVDLAFPSCLSCSPHSSRA